MNNHWFAIINPASGYGKANKKWDEVAEILKAENIQYSFAFTTIHEKATVAVKTAIEKGFRQFICIGGDGHLQDTVNGILQQNTVDSNEITLCMISAGTGNDWIKTSGVPKDAKSAIQLIKTGKKITQNIGKINYTIQDKIAERYFINFAGVGFDAYVVSETKSLKKYGQIAYLLGMIKCLFSYKKPTVKISFNDTQIITPIYMAIAGVGQYGGGGMKLMPSANLTGEDFCFVIIKNIPIWKVILNIGKLYTGTLTTLKEVDLFHTKKIKIENINCNIPLLMESDGEDIGEGPFEISIINHKINILVP